MISLFTLFERRGINGKREKMGGNDMCYCDSCGKSFPHKRGAPCIKQTCPECGEPLRGNPVKI